MLRSQPNVYIETGATFSECGQYRYALWRVWDKEFPTVMFIGLNPSTADADDDDPTIRRCVRFAKRWGCGRLTMGNLFAFRATDPRELGYGRRGEGLRLGDIVGPLNNGALRVMIGEALHIVAAWGTRGALRSRDREVRAFLPPGHTWTLGLTKGGHPKHPLYVPAVTPRQPFPFSLDPAY